MLAGVFGCKIQSLPFTYLGLPMGTTKPRVEHYAPLMNRTERRLTATSNFLTHAGRLQLVNSVLSSLPTYAMCSLQVPAAVWNTSIGQEGTACGEVLTLMLK